MNWRHDDLRRDVGRLAEDEHSPAGLGHFVDQELQGHLGAVIAVLKCQRTLGSGKGPETLSSIWPVSVCVVTMQI